MKWRSHLVSGWQSWASFTSVLTSTSVVARAPDRNFSAPIRSIAVTRCLAAHLRTRTLRCLETREQTLGQREKEGQKHSPWSQHAPHNCWGKEACVLAAIVATCRRFCPQINTKLALYKETTCKEEGGIQSPWTIWYSISFPKLTLRKSERKDNSCWLGRGLSLHRQSCRRI